MTPEETQKRVEDLELQIKKQQLVELELRTILADRAAVHAFLADSKAHNAEWSEHVDISNKCNTRLAEAMERLVATIEEKFS
jgi:hypothetical protein